MKICSLFFIVGGFLYTYFLLGYFNINVALYYGISDYIAGSIDVLFNIFVLLILLSIGMIFQFDKMIRRQIYNKELDIENRISDRLEYFTIIFCLSLLIINYLIKKEVNISIFIIFIMVLIFLILSKIKLFNYLENPSSIFIFIIGLTMFGSQLAFKIDRDIKYVLKGEKKVNISLKDEYKNFEDWSFITMNSNYIFLWDKKENKSIVLPLSTISNLNSIEIKK